MKLLNPTQTGGGGGREGGAIVPRMYTLLLHISKTVCSFGLKFFDMPLCHHYFQKKSLFFIMKLLFVLFVFNFCISCITIIIMTIG